MRRAPFSVRPLFHNQLGTAKNKKNAGENQTRRSLSDFITKFYKETTLVPDLYPKLKLNLICEKIRMGTPFTITSLTKSLPVNMEELRADFLNM